jgi:DNA processing protein
LNKIRGHEIDFFSCPFLILVSKLHAQVKLRDRSFTCANELLTIIRKELNMKHEIKSITWESPLYPQKLREIYDPPKELYYIGDITLLNAPSISMIGCRNASPYGLRIANIFSQQLAKEGYIIVSGFARGIDQEAHKGCLAKSGKTIAVMGSGLDIIYPRDSEDLFDEIINKGGLVISEFPLGTPPYKENFPQRNRIVSGLCDKLVVVEAKKKSGTLITVDFALEQGKDVYVIPGNIDSLNSEGTNELIKQGAIMLTSYKELIT